MPSNELFSAEYPIDGDVVMSIAITKGIVKYSWSINIGINKEKSEIISLRGDGESISECMTRMRNLLLGMMNVIDDLIIDLKQYVFDEYDEDEDAFGGKNAKFN